MSKKKKRRASQKRAPEKKKVNLKPLIISACCVLIAAIIVVATIFIVKAIKVNKTLKMPKDTSLDFWILNKGTEPFDDYLVENMWDHAYRYVSKDYGLLVNDNKEIIAPEECVTYLVTTYPDYTSKNYYLTRIDVSDPNVKVFGLDINTSIDNFKKVMLDNGFTIDEKECVESNKSQDTYIIIARSYANKYSITLNAFKGSKMIIIEAPTTDKHGLIE